MIEDNTTWYLGTVGSGNSYKLAKYTDSSGATLTSSTTIAKVGLLRLGELMTGQFDSQTANTSFYCLTPFPLGSDKIWAIIREGAAYSYTTNNSYGIKPAFNLKENVIIASGDGTLQNPFQIELK